MTQPPWLARPEWEARTIPNRNRGSVLGASFLGAFGLIWIGFLVSALRKDGISQRAIFSAAALSLVGYFLIGVAILLIVSAIRSRRLVLRLETLPGVVGGHVSGTIHGMGGMPRDEMTLRLECWRRDELSWSHVQNIDAADATVPFRFDVPRQCEPTGGDVEWRIAVRTPDGGAAGSFEVPVHRT